MSAFSASVLTASVVVALAFGATAFGGAVTAAWIDARTGRLPDRWVALTSAGTLGVALAAANGWRGPLVGTAVVAGPLLAGHVLSPSAVGFGDVKFAAAIGPALGSFGVVPPLLALWFATGITTLLGLVGRSRTVTLGPGLVAGGLLALGLAGRGGS